ncbi:MAG: hypothetical protein JJ956_00460 [Pseudomonadales bacterium]|nr:hypothetical protein [Pseudomonadales bacterium]
MTLLLACASNSLGAPDFDTEGAAPGNMRFAWIHGSISAKHNQDVRIQVHQYNAHTYILRQNPAVHWEAPFMYLLFGEERAVLLDTGATENADYFPLRSQIDALIQRWKVANRVADIELLVLPLGSEASQVSGLTQFDNRANTQLLSPDTDTRRTWLQDNALDLGQRSLAVINTPGIDDAAISLYDPFNHFLFTGNSFYPGRLVIRNFEAYKDSLSRLNTFAAEHPVKWIMGGRIEMSDTPGIDYRLRSNYRPREHALQMPPELITDGYQIVHLINGREDIRIHEDFIVMNGVGRGARDYGWPSYTPRQYQRPFLR